MSAHDEAAQHRHDADRHEYDNLRQQTRTALEHIVALRRRALYDAARALVSAEAALAECEEE